MTKVRSSKPFERGLKGLPPNRKEAAITALRRFMAEPALPSLKFRPLAGKKDHFIISSVHGDRIILRREDEEMDAEAGQTFTAVDVGPHDNVYRRWNRK